MFFLSNSAAKKVDETDLLTFLVATSSSRLLSLGEISGGHVWLLMLPFKGLKVMSCTFLPAVTEEQQQECGRPNEHHHHGADHGGGRRRRGFWVPQRQNTTE